MTNWGPRAYRNTGEGFSSLTTNQVHLQVLLKDFSHVQHDEISILYVTSILRYYKIPTIEELQVLHVPSRRLCLKMEYVPGCCWRISTMPSYRSPSEKNASSPYGGESIHLTGNLGELKNLSKTIKQSGSQLRRVFSAPISSHYSVVKKVQSTRDLHVRRAETFLYSREILKSLKLDECTYDLMEAHSSWHQTRARDEFSIKPGQKRTHKLL